MIKYKYEEAVEASLKYFKGDDLAAKSFVNKYALKDTQDTLFESTPDDMHKRITKEIHRIELNYKNPLSEKEIYNVLKNFKYIIPQGGPMTGIGNNEQIVSLSNCFVIGINGPADSYGAIFKIDQEQVQIMKRRGGCIEENQYVIIKNKGIVKISECKIGDYILSYNIKTTQPEYKKILDKFYTDVKKSNRIAILYKNGTVLRTSKKHPILTYTDDYTYVDASTLKINDVGIKPQPGFYNYTKFDKDKTQIAWFIGTHLGDGTCNIDNSKRYRFRNSGDNENVISEYTNILNKMLGTNCTYKLEKNIKHYCDVWRVSVTKIDASNFINTYLDNQIGKKTYTCFTPEYIKKNNLWIPFLAGLIDADGNVDSKGRVSIGLSSYQMISELACFLSSIGIEYNVRLRDYSKCNPNWNTSYTLTLHTNIEFYKEIQKYLIHDIKRNNIRIDTVRKFSHKKYLTEIERTNILNTYNNKQYSSKSNKSNLRSIIRLLKKNKNLGIGALSEFNEYEILDDKKYLEIQSRTNIKEIIDESNLDLKYIDIKVEGNNNYYAGDFGFVCTHNCGHDLSAIRPAGMPVKNSALTSTGVVPFMERYSNSTREVAQDGRRGALMQTISIVHPDAEGFIDAKMTDGKITGANVSIRITDQFMQSVINKSPFRQYFPIDDPINPKVSQNIDADKLWNKIVHNAWKSAEPGLLFWDTIIRESVPDCYITDGFKTTSTNPCVTGDTIVNTNKGNIKISNIVNRFNNGEQFEIWSYNENNSNVELKPLYNAQKTKENAEILKIETENGSIIKLTPDHLVLTEEDGWIEAAKLTINHTLLEIKD